MNKCAIYARVSTDDQNTSIINQQEYFKEYINRNEWELFDIYTDEAFTGTESSKRQSFQRMINDGINKKFDILLAKSYSRFGRNQRETLNVLSDFFTRGIRIIFIEDGLDSSRDKGQFGLFAWLAEQESRKVSERIKLVWQHYNQQGKLHVCTPPYGYDYSPEIKNYIINIDESKIIILIFNLYIKGNGFNKIANMLREKNIKTKKQGQWASATIKGILQNHVYIGSLVQGKSKNIDVTIKERQKVLKENWYIHEKNHESIISKEVFDKVQDLLKKRTGSKYKRHSNTSLFSNLIKCKECNSSFTIKRQKHFKNYEPYYSCIKYELQGKIGAGHTRNTIYEKDLLLNIRQTLEYETKNNFITIKNYYKTLNVKNDINSLKKELQLIEKKIKESTELSMSLLTAFSKNIIGENQFKLQNDTIENELNILIKRKEELKLNSLDNQDCENNEQQAINSIKKLLLLETDKWTNAMLKEIIDCIIIGQNNECLVKYTYQNS